MKGIERLAAVKSSTPRMVRAVSGLPMKPTVMIRLIRISAYGLGNFFEPVFRALPISEHAFHCLCLLMASENGRASPGELSEMVGTSRAYMTRILEELLNAKFVTRAINARDARRHEIRITASGRRMVDEMVPSIAEPLTRAFSGLKPEEFDLLDGLLQKLIVSLDESARDLRAAA